MQYLLQGYKRVKKDLIDLIEKECEVIFGLYFGN